MNKFFCDCPENIKAQCRCSGCDQKAFDCFRRFSMIMASAGTGKTYSLSMRYLQLLSFGVKPSEILAVTFTRKATGEIFDEIIANLLKLIASSHKCQLARKEKLLLILKQLLCSNDRRIGTIDSFFGSLLQAYAPELGISGDITMIDAKDDRQVKKVIRQWLKSTSGEDKDELRELLKSANNGELMNFEASMSKIIEDLYGFYQKTIQDRNTDYVWGTEFESVQKLANPEQDELKYLGDKIKDIAQKCSNVTASQRLETLAQYISGDRKGNIPDNVKKMLGNFNDHNDPDWLFEKGLPLNHTTKVIFSGEDADCIRKALGVVIKNQLEKCRKKTQAVYRLMQKFDELYNRNVRNKGMLTFDDFPLILRNRDEAGDLHLFCSDTMSMEERLDATINHYLFDEFQDTSNAQWYIFSNLIDEILSSRDDEFRSLFCVGDIKQSIYQWRGGDPYLFERVIEETRKKTSDLGYDPQRELFKSFRSSQDILDVVNITFTPDNSSIPLNQSMQRMKFTTHISERKNFPGFTAVIDTSAMIKNQILENQAAIINRVLKEISPFSRAKKLTVGVLMQENKDCEALAEKLKEISGDLPISIEGKIALTSSMAFTVLRKLIILADHPGDTAARNFLKMLSGSIRTGFERITPQVIAEKMKYNVQENCGCDELAAMIRKDIFQNRLDGFIQHFLTAFGNEFSNFDYDRIEAARSLAENFKGTPEEFLDAVDKWYKLEDQSVECTVQFMTIHKSKGLGFDIVFLPDISSKTRSESNSFVTSHPTEIKNSPQWVNCMPLADICRAIPELAEHQLVTDQEHLFEECCKFYVAMTRAKRAMYIFADNKKAEESAHFTVSESGKIHFQDLMCQKLKANVTLSATPEFRQLLKESAIWNSEPLICWNGNENWFKNGDIQELEKTTVAPAQEFVIHPSKKQRTLASHQHDNDVFIPPESRFASHIASNTGTLLHELFEKIEYVSPDFDADAFLNGVDAAPEVAEIFRKAMKNGSELRGALSRPEQPHILWQERRFLVKSKSGATVPGAFDRVTIFLDHTGKMDHAEILDFKSDNVSNTKELISCHRGQMTLYRECLSRMTGIPEEKIKLSLAALRLGKIAEIK